MHLHTLSAAVLLAIGTLAAAAPAADNKKLNNCLKPLGSKVITSNNRSQYERERYAFDLRYTYKPQVIVMAKSNADVQTAVKCAKDANVAVKGDKAKVGAGIRLGKLYLDLFKQGGWTINAGTCPSVGIGGHATGGGFGLLARKHGLLIDRIVEMEMVDANGKLLT
ncbi:hypothetical protein BGZ68_010017, partial [Mortierella alpina]